MNSYKIDIAKMDNIIKKTIEAINNSKAEIYEIAESARRECKRLEEDMHQLKDQVNKHIDTVEKLEEGLKQSKRKLMYVNRNHNLFTQEELKAAYDTADSFRIQLAIKREQEQYLIRRRNELEIRIKEAYNILQKADNLIQHVVVALSFLTGDLQEVSLQLEGIQQRRQVGLKIIRAQEDERQRVARDIHDGPAQSMSNVVIKAEICEKLIDLDTEKAKEELRSLKKIVRDSMQDVRKILYNLRPMSLDDLGLVPTLQRYILTFMEDSGIKVTLNTNGICSDIRPEISLTVFRVFQESISNVNKHANADNVIIDLDFSDDEIKLTVCDDGRGFSIEEFKLRNEEISSGYGLLSMRERIELLGGEFMIYSEISKGTRLDFTIPLTKVKMVKEN